MQTAAQQQAAVQQKAAAQERERQGRSANRCPSSRATWFGSSSETSCRCHKGLSASGVMHCPLNAGAITIQDRALLSRPTWAHRPPMQTHAPHHSAPSFPPPSHPQGKTLDQTLREALQPVPNPHSDSGIAQLNRIRESLRLIAANSTAVGLPQASMGCAAQAVV